MTKIFGSIPGPQGEPGPQGPQGPKGDKGDKGDQGDPGAAATIAAGSVTTLAPGSPATVTNVGTPSAAIFDFGIPQGATGATGPQGPSGDTFDPGNQVLLYDDFVTGQTTGLGQINWCVSGSGGRDFNANTETGIYGMIRMFSGGSANQQSSMHTGNEGNNQALGDHFNARKFDLRCKFKLLQTTQQQLAIGLTDGTGVLSLGQGVYLRAYTNESANFRWATQGIGGNLFVSSGIAIDTNWHTFRVRCLDGAGTFLFSLDGGAEVAQTYPGGDTNRNLWFMHSINNLENANKLVYIDYSYLKIYDLTR